MHRICVKDLAEDANSSAKQCKRNKLGRTDMDRLTDSLGSVCLIFGTGGLSPPLFLPDCSWWNLELRIFDGSNHDVSQNPTMF